MSQRDPYKGRTINSSGFAEKYKIANIIHGSYDIYLFSYFYNFNLPIKFLTGMLDIFVMGSIFSTHPILTSGIHKAQLT